MPHSTDPAPPISGLVRVHDAFGDTLTYGQPDGVDYDDSGPLYDCWGGEPHILFPLIHCPAPGPSGASFAPTFHTDPSYWPGGIPPLDIAPQPDLAIVELQIGLRFQTWTDGCKAGGSPTGGVGVDDETGFGCATPFHGTGEATVTPAFSTPGGVGTFNWQPWAGWDTQTYDPGRDPAYDTASGAEWSQVGSALIAPPSPVYTDPDPLDPNIDHVPYLWNWADITDQAATVDVAGDTWHRILVAATGTNAATIIVYPYWLSERPASGWMQVL